MRSSPCCWRICGPVAAAFAGCAIPPGGTRARSSATVAPTPGRSSMSGRIFVPGSSGCRRSGAASTLGSITHSSPIWDESPIIGNSRSDTRPQLYERPDFRAGLKRLSALGLSFDAWLYHPQLADVVDLARAFPATPIVMGHVGGVLGYGPYGRRDEVFAD